MSTVIIDEILKEYAKEIGLDPIKEKDLTFELFAAEQLLKQKDLDQDEISDGLVGGSQDNGIDGFYIFIDDEYITTDTPIEKSKKRKKIEVHLHQYKNSTAIQEVVLHKLNTVTSSILNLDNDFSSSNWGTDLIEKIKLLHKIILNSASSHPEYEIFYRHVCKGNRSDVYSENKKNHSYLDKVNVLNQTLKSTDIGSDVTFNFDLIGRNELMVMNRQEKQFSLSLKLNENPIALDFSDDGKRGYIASANLKEYYNFIADENKTLRNYLFDSNIRDFQNNTATNIEISKTIESEKKLDFWWLNNGVTILADKGSLTGKVLNLDNVQIVNGLQTSYSIYNSFTNNVFDSENRSILLKIIITSDKITTDRVIKSTNSQNPVPTSLLRATDTIQRDIEDYFYLNDYYYDRRKNYYRNLKKPIKKIISINFLAQCLTSLAIIDKNPSKARSNPTILTKEDNDYNNLFNEKRDIKVYLKSVQIVKKVDEVIKEVLTNNDIDGLNEKLKKYYLFHISRIVVSILLSKQDYNEKEMASVNVEKINEAIVNKSLSTLRGIIDSYIKETRHDDIVNISKQTEFSRYITKNLKF